MSKVQRSAMFIEIPRRFVVRTITMLRAPSKHKKKRGNIKILGPENSRRFNLFIYLFLLSSHSQQIEIGNIVVLACKKLQDQDHHSSGGCLHTERPVQEGIF